MTTDRPTLSDSPLSRIAQRVGSAWWVLLIVGIAWIVIGFIVAQYSGASIVTIAAIAGVVLLLGAVNEGIAASLTRGGWRVLHIVLAVLFAIGGIVLLASPGGTFVALVGLIGLLFVVFGVVDIITSLFEIGSVRGWWLQLIAGILQLLLGILASTSVANSIVVLITVVSLGAIFRGVADIAAAFGVRELKRA